MIAEISRDSAAWDSFVAAAPDASNYHRWLWQLPIHETFGHQPWYLAARDSEGIQGILPLVSLRSRLFGRFLVSIPFFSYGGMLARSEEAGASLLQKAVEIAKDLGAQHIELRQVAPFSGEWTSVSSKVTMVVPLPSRVDELWNRLSTGMRNKIRYARKHGLTARWGGLESVADFYPVFAANMRNLGTPVYPRCWFENLCKYNPEIRILTLWDGDRAVAGAFLTPFRDTLEFPWSGSLPESRKKYSHVLLYWTFLEWAIQEGFQRVDLGRCTPGGGTWEFKRHWMCEEKPLQRFYWLAPGKTLPQVNLQNSRYHLAVRIWQHLPLRVANLLGPRIVRSIP